MDNFDRVVNDVKTSMDSIRETIDPPITDDEIMAVFNGTMALAEIVYRPQCTKQVRALAMASLSGVINVMMAVLTTKQVVDMAERLEQLAYAMDAAARQSPN